MVQPLRRMEISNRGLSLIEHAVFEMDAGTRPDAGPPLYTTADHVFGPPLGGRSTSSQDIEGKAGIEQSSTLAVAH
jgi:hypothetical protein